jgi:hypothetical protein
MATEQSQGLWTKIQPAAVVLTALFGIFVYWKKDAPMLEPRSRAIGTLGWSETANPTICRATFEVTLENEGVTAFEVRKVRVRAWQFPDVVQMKPGFAFDDVDAAVQNVKPLTDETYKARDNDVGQSIAPPLVARYASGMGYIHTFGWLVPKAPTERFYVRADIFRSDDDRVASWYASQWSAVCEVGLSAAASAAR